MLSVFVYRVLLFLYLRNCFKVVIVSSSLRRSYRVPSIQLLAQQHLNSLLTLDTLIDNNLKAITG